MAKWKRPPTMCLTTEGQRSSSILHSRENHVGQYHPSVNSGWPVFKALLAIRPKTPSIIWRPVTYRSSIISLRLCANIRIPGNSIQNDRWQIPVFVDLSPKGIPAQLEALACWCCYWTHSRFNDFCYQSVADVHVDVRIIYIRAVFSKNRRKHRHDWL